MSNVLEFYIKLKDMMSSGLAKVAQTAKAAGQQIMTAFKGVESSMDSAADKSKKIGENISNAGKRAKEASFSFKSLAREIGIGLSVASLVAFTKSSLAQSAQAENQRIAFKVLLGDKFKGDNLFGQIRHMADTTPYESKELMQSAKMLLGFGERGNRIMPDLKALGDVAAAQDDPTQALLGLSHAYGEVIASGRLLGRNTLEMINWGFNPLKEISIMTGRSMGDLKKAEEQGAISADMVRKAFVHATSAGGKYNDMMKEQAGTLGGQWSTFMDLVHAKMRSFGDSLAPVAKQVMGFLTQILNAGAPGEWKQFSDETDRLRGLRIELGLSNTTNQRRIDIFHELRANYPSIVENIKNEKDALDKLAPSLDNYLNKRYLASGVLKIKEQYASDLSAVAEANTRIPETHGQSVALAAMLAGKYGVDSNGQSAGQLEGNVIAKLQSIIRSGKSHQIYDGGSIINQEATDLLSLQSLITQNSEAQKLYQTHIQGANKAKAAIDQFNKIMGVSQSPAGGAPGSGGGNDSDMGADLPGRIAAGGPRVININGGVKFTDKFDMHVTDFKGGVEQVREAFQDMLLRVLNSGASVQQ